MTATGVTTDRNDALLCWFDSNARNLPWRTTPDPYPILVSEVMLQQTQVERVIPKYTSFIESWPTAGCLANADTTELLRAWSGLGYNNRALRLRDAAKIIAESGWPTSIAGLQKLPGVGPYTASAVGSIALGLDVPAIDTNLRRVLRRWKGEALSGKALVAFAFESVGDPAGDWNQALMDLGSVFCRPLDPVCGDCPVEDWCTDPSVYEAPISQGVFNGSNRQLRGILVRAHLSGVNPLEAVPTPDWSIEDVQSTLCDLRSEGLIED